jgi:hypothetical protein
LPREDPEALPSRWWDFGRGDIDTTTQKIEEVFAMYNHNKKRVNARDGLIINDFKIDA